jgi:hypothetical protein
MDLNLRIEASETWLPSFHWSFVLAILVGLISGAYPALFLSSFHPVDGIKGDSMGRALECWRFQPYHGDHPIYHFGGHHCGNLGRIQSIEIFA